MEKLSRPNQILPHTPVLLKEVLEYLEVKDGGEYLDCTFGAGGYSRKILETANCTLTAIDQDPEVEIFAHKLTKEYPQRFKFIQANFAAARDSLSANTKFDGIVADIGVSSMQLDQGERGFSFSHAGPLDMRMSRAGYSAADFINQAEEEEIADIIYNYGDETASRKIAKKIVSERILSPITTTEKLAEIVRSVVGTHKGKSKIDPATKTFQAIRIYINDELGALESLLAQIKDLLKPGGCLVIVCFHSLEDGIVKQFFKTISPKHVAKSKYAKDLATYDPDKPFKILTKKPITPSKEEVILNPRARSAKLRAIVKIGGKDDNTRT